MHLQFKYRKAVPKFIQKAQIIWGKTHCTTNLNCNLSDSSVEIVMSQTSVVLNVFK